MLTANLDSVMDDDPLVSKIYDVFNKAGQGHVFTFYSSLTLDQKKSFIHQLKCIGDPFKLNQLWKKATENHVIISDKQQLPDKIQPLEENSISSSSQNDSLSKEWWTLGINLIKKRKVAVITLAGGQGTRLGSSSPKGCYDIGLPSHKSLFQIQAEKLFCLQKLSQSIIYWYLMTSEGTHEETISFFKSHRYFDWDPEQIVFFKQGFLPSFDQNGKIILETKDKIFLAPDGNGGMFNALYKENLIQDMKNKGIEHVHVYCVDNVLVKVADPTFIGYCHAGNYDCGSKVVEKKDPKESVGLIVKKNGKYTVMEYSEMPSSLVNLREGDGKMGVDKLAYRHGNIANHYFHIRFLEKLCSSDVNENGLLYHVAKKKIPFMCTDKESVDFGNVIMPNAPNGIKLELFIFDVFPLASSMAIFEVSREEEFSPLKNGPGSGADSPETARQEWMNLCIHFLKLNGWKMKSISHPNGNSKDHKICTENLVCDISPKLTYQGEGLPDFSNVELNFPLIINEASDWNLYKLDKTSSTKQSVN